MSSGNHILLKLLSENQFSGKTYFYTIAYRRGEEELRGRRGGPAARAGRRGDAGVAGQEGDGQEEPGRQFDSIKITSGHKDHFWAILEAGRIAFEALYARILYKGASIYDVRTEGGGMAQKKMQ